MSWRKRLTPLTLGLLAFGLFDCVLVNLALRYSPWQPQLYTTLQYTAAYFQGVALDDS